MSTLPKDAVLLTIDVQKGMDVFRDKYHRNNPDLERNIARLVARSPCCCWMH